MSSEISSMKTLVIKILLGLVVLGSAGRGPEFEKGIDQ
jgi:hypothetical protein